MKISINVNIDIDIIDININMVAAPIRRLAFVLLWSASRLNDPFQSHST